MEKLGPHPDDLPADHPTDDTDDTEAFEEPGATGASGIDIAIGHNGNLIVDLQSLALWLWGPKKAQTTREAGTKANERQSMVSN